MYRLIPPAGIDVTYDRSDGQMTYTEVLDCRAYPESEVEDTIDRMDEIVRLLSDGRYTPSVERDGDYVVVTYDIDAQSHEAASLLAFAALMSAVGAGADVDRIWHMVNAIERPEFDR